MAAGDEGSSLVTYAIFPFLYLHNWGVTYQTKKKNQTGIWRQWADLEEVLVCVGKGHVHTGVLVIGMALTVQPQTPVDTTGAGAAVFGVHRVVVRTPLLILWDG